jgi:hypothetical protein
MSHAAHPTFRTCLSAVNPRLPLILASLLVGLSSTSAQQPESTVADASAAMDQTRALLQQWATTQRLIASERSDWENGKAMIAGRIQLLKISVEETEKKIAEARTKLEDVKKRTAEAEAEKALIKEASDALLATAPELEKGVKGLYARVPGVIQEKVKVLHERIPKEGADLKNITAAERFQNVLGILNELGKANTELTSLPEIHDIGDGKKWSMSASARVTLLMPPAASAARDFLPTKAGPGKPIPPSRRRCARSSKS